MAQAGLVPDLAIVSTAVRTQESWALVSPAFSAAIAKVDERRIYEAPARRLLTVVQETPDDVHTVVMVGHNPGMEDLATSLAGKGTDRDAGSDLARMRDKYPTGGLAVIDFDLTSWADVTAGTGMLDRFVTPRSLDRPDHA
ncbi:MAG: histidine phosphatase family protein [Sphingobium sp.]